MVCWFYYPCTSSEFLEVNRFELNGLISVIIVGRLVLVVWSRNTEIVTSNRGIILAELGSRNHSYTNCFNVSLRVAGATTGPSFVFTPNPFDKVQNKAHLKVIN